ncbi:MAG: helix-turn-helix domain-containing protein [Alistipes sp.]|nr:helix-turn-helix domain-containing protein [Alistipes sp.]
MREKLQQLMNAEQLTGSKLAEYLGIQPSSISHIMGGRNKPSLDFVQKILQRYPCINPDWLLLDSDEMYRPQTSPAPSIEVNAQLPFAGSDTPSEDSMSQPEATTTNPMPQPLTNTPTNPSAEAMAMFGSASSTQHGGVKRVIVLYEDRTFESYEPQR